MISQPTASRPGLRPVFLGFGALGFVVGVWQVILPDLQAALRLSPGGLGSALTIGFLGSFPAMLIGGRLADRFGARRLIAGAALAMGLAFLSLAVVNSWWLLVAVLPVYYAGLGALDVGINAAAIGVEQITGRRVMAYFHAAYSGLAALGALSGGLLLWVGAPFRWQYVLGAAVLAAMAGMVWRSRVLPVAAQASQANHTPAVRQGLLSLPAAIFVLATMASLGIFSESTLENWSAIYLRSAIGLPAVLGAAGPAVFQSAMLAGRLGSGRLVGRLGRRRLLLWAGVLTAGGMGLALGTASLPLILGGLLVAGLALAGIVPVALSLAGDLAPGRAGAASSLLITVGYLGPLIGPALVGGLAQVAGLRLALGAVVVAGLLVLTLGLRLREAGLRPVTARPEPEAAG